MGGHAGKGAQPINASQLPKGAIRGYKPTVQEAEDMASINNISQGAALVKLGLGPQNDRRGERVEAPLQIGT